MSGWIKLHRKLRKNPYMKRPSYRSIWIELLLEASHGEKTIIWRGSPIKVLPGQLTCGSHQLAEWTGVPRGTVERILKCFKNEQMIEVQTSNKFSLITINNWSEYQANEEQDEEQMRSKRGASEEPVRTPKELKNVRIKELKNKHMDFVMLTTEEYEKLSKEYPGVVQGYIEKLNIYIGSTGKRYKSHYFTLLNWIKKDKDNPPKAPFRSDTPQILKYNPPTNV